MNSCLYVGHVRHQRWLSADHRFQYKLYMAYLDLDELPLVLGQGHGLGRRAFSPASFCRRDHLGDPQVPLADEVRDLVEGRTGRRPAGPVRLLTLLRNWGCYFCPLCLYYCFDPADQAVEAVVAEVSNTPWNERHCYVLDLLGQAPSGGFLKAEQPKEFHVSPFMDMDATYQFRFGTPGETLVVHIDSERRGARFFQAGMTLTRTPITGRSLARVALRRPLMTAKVIFVIHWQALRLWRKGAPYVPHPGRVIPASRKGEGAR
jgi:uncharacterized protein